MANDRLAQEKLYKHFYADMFRVCRQYTDDAHNALTILNDGFLKVFRNISQYQSSIGSFNAWVKTIMVNTAIDHIRKDKRKPAHVHLEAVHEPGDDDLRMASHWKQEELSQHFKLLPAITRLVLSLVAFEGYTHKDISQHLNITETTSRWHLAEARKRLRVSMQLKK